MKVAIILVASLSCVYADIDSQEKLVIIKDTLGSSTENRSTSGDLGTLIVGGTPANKNEFPWLVHLQIGGSFCGGSLISMDTVLTAAHCVYRSSAGSIRVIAGDHYLNTNEGTEQESEALLVKWHEGYNPNSYTGTNDIALVKLAKNLTRTAAVDLISLPESSFIIDAAVQGIAAGWGTTSYESSISNTLLKVSVPIVINEICGNVYNLTNTQFCAGENGKDSCQGDSGGPFLCNNRNVICGIVSYGIGCGSPNYPGVYTKVSSHVDWIKTAEFASSGSLVFPIPSLSLFTILYIWIKPF
ncbi:unnamed protein product [Orchesella dallaii]|uniref:Peptidase S1 domain-containing protein n=1 Tax=Orchesella dallaii TaxID=48710 RepID=A0ABP1QFG4_9HEXA